MNKQSIHSFSRRVRYLDENGHDADREFAAASGLVKGQVYDVAGIEVGSWNTSVWLKGFPGLPFNSVMFEDVGGPLEAQCWICPWCYDDHRSDGPCKQEDLHREIKTLREALDAATADDESAGPT